MNKGKDLTGQIFGRLTVISFSFKDKHRCKHYLCLCECGKEKIISGRSLTRKNTTSCGCFQLEKAAINGKARRTNGRIISAKMMWKNSYKDGLSFKDFLDLSQQNCFYCGSEPDNLFNSYINKKGEIKKDISQEWAEQSWFKYNGLDRIDSSLSHTKDNLVVCCASCNYAKSDMTLDEFRSWVIKISNYLNKEQW